MSQFLISKMRIIITLSHTVVVRIKVIHRELRTVPKLILLLLLPNSSNSIVHPKFMVLQVYLEVGYLEN